MVSKFAFVLGHANLGSFFLVLSPKICILLKVFLKAYGMIANSYMFLRNTCFDFSQDWDDVLKGQGHVM